MKWIFLFISFPADFTSCCSLLPYFPSRPFHSEHFFCFLIHFRCCLFLSQFLISLRFQLSLSLLVLLSLGFEQSSTDASTEPTADITTLSFARCQVCTSNRREARARSSRRGATSSVILTGIITCSISFFHFLLFVICWYGLKLSFSFLFLLRTCAPSSGPRLSLTLLLVTVTSNSICVN